MESQKKAFKIAAIAVIAMAAAMYFFYFVKDRTRKTDADVDLNQKVAEPVHEEKQEFVGVYSPQSALEAEGKRISYFQVNRKEDGGYLGSAKVDTVGGEEAVYLNCVDVRIEEKDFFLKCVDDKVGVISYNGQWQKTANTVQVSGHVFWSKEGNSFLDKDVQLLLTP
ncbi:MAG: hypothetical protein ACXVBE_17775 [Bdellovibrionota bacterium]